MNQLEKFTKLLNSQQVIGIPTETVYGLAAKIDSPKALKEIFHLKERPFFDPLIVHVNGIEMAKSLCSSWPKEAQILAENFWPGPLTLVLPKNDKIDPLITSGLNDVGLRCPNHPLTLKLIKNLGVALAAPSANKFKKISPTTAAHVKDEFIDLEVLDGGSCDIGIESTVCGVIKDKSRTIIKIYRPGLITKKQIENILIKNNFEVLVEYAESPVSPGAMKHHYMPKIPLILLDDNQSFQENFLKACEVLNIKPTQISELILPHQANLAARLLYSELRRISNTNAAAILIKRKDYFNEDDWLGIANRLTKAKSYPR